MPTNPTPPTRPTAAIKLGSQRLATIIKARATAAAAAAQEGAAAVSEGAAAAALPGPDGAIAKIRATATGLGAMARQTSNRLTEGFKRLAVGDPLLAVCRSEPHTPQLVLACATALVVGGGVWTEGIFKVAPPADEVEKLLACVGERRGGGHLE